MNKKGYALLLLSAAVVYAAWVYYGHEQRALSRLLRTGVINEKAKVELVHSSGFTRDNWHLFKVSPGGVRIEKGYLRDPKNEFDLQEMRWAIKDINRHSSFSLKADNAKFYDISKPGGYLVFLTVVERAEGDFLVLMRVM